MSDDLRQGVTPVVHRLLDIRSAQYFLGASERGFASLQNEAWDVLKRARRNSSSGTSVALGLRAAALLLLAAEDHDLYLLRLNAPTPSGEGSGVGK